MVGGGVVEVADEVATDRMYVREMALHSLTSCTRKEQRRLCICCEKGRLFSWKPVRSVGKNRDIEVFDNIPRWHIVVVRVQLIVCESMV